MEACCYDRIQDNAPFESSACKRNEVILFCHCVIRTGGIVKDHGRECISVTDVFVFRTVGILIVDYNAGAAVIVFFVAGNVRLVFRAGLGLALSSFAQSSCSVNVRELALALLAVGAVTMVGVIRTLEDMTAIALLTLGAIAESSERTANGSRRGDVDVGIAACSVRAVAAKKVRAGRDAMVRRLVRHIAIVAGLAPTIAQPFFADGDFRGIVGELAARTERAGTCNIISLERVDLPACFKRQGSRRTAAVAGPG